MKKVIYGVCLVSDSYRHTMNNSDRDWFDSLGDAIQYAADLLADAGCKAQYSGEYTKCSYGVAQRSEYSFNFCVDVVAENIDDPESEIGYADFFFDSGSGEYVLAETGIENEEGVFD